MKIQPTAAAATLLVLLIGALPQTGAANEDAERYAAAEEAIRGFREQTFLITDCEARFAAFWRAYRAEGDRSLVYETDPLGERVYFGFGNPAGEPLLEDARAACYEQTGGQASMVLRVLRDRALEKERRHRHFRHAERVIGAW